MRDPITEVLDAPGMSRGDNARLAEMSPAWDRSRTRRPGTPPRSSAAAVGEASVEILAGCRGHQLHS